jgi:hypothetical protein
LYRKDGNSRRSSHKNAADFNEIMLAQLLKKGMAVM